MRIEALNKDLLFYNMKDEFDIITESAIQHLQIRLDILFGRQTDLQKANEDLAQDSLNDGFITSVATAANDVDEAEWLLEAIDVRSIDLLKYFRDLSESAIHQLNKYYAMIRSDATVDNISWSQDMILSSCEESLRDKIRKVFSE